MTSAAAQLLRDPSPALEQDEQLLVHFVVWNLRVRDLPHAVREAAARVAATRRHPRIAAGDSYVDAPYRVSALPRDEAGPIVDLCCDRRNAPQAVSELLVASTAYVIVTDLSVTPEAI